MEEEQLKYREAALKHLSAPDDIGEALNILPIWHWVFLLGVYLVLVSTVIWGVFGSISSTVIGGGILLVENNNVTIIDAPEGIATLQTLNVHVGDMVKKGQLLAVLDRPTAAQEYAISKAQFEKSIQDFHLLKQQAEEGIHDETENKQTQIDTLTSMIKTDKERLASLTGLLEAKRQTVKSGVTSVESFVSTNLTYLGIVRDIESEQQQIDQMKAGLRAYKEQWNQRLLDGSQMLDRNRYAMQTQEERLKTSANLISPVDGVVLGLSAHQGGVLQGSETIMTISPVGQGLEAWLFLPSQDGKKIKEGMEAQISPASFSKEEYGSLLGKVIGVRLFPSSKKEMFSIIPNEDLINKLTNQESAMIVVVRIDRDPATFSGYKWTSKDGPKDKITPGSIVSGRIVYKRQAPFSLIMPMLRQVFEP